MKTLKLYLAIAGFITTITLSAQDPTFIGQVNKVIVSDGILLQIERSTGYRLEIKSGDLTDDCLVKTAIRGELTLKIKSGFGCKGTVSAILYCPTIKELDISGRAEVNTKNMIQGDSLAVRIKTGGQAYVDMDVKYLNAIVSEGGLMVSEGYAVKQDVKVSTSSTFSAIDLEGESVNISTSIGSTAKIHVTEDLNANATSNSYIGYKGTPKFKNEKAVSGAVIEPITGGKDF